MDKDDPWVVRLLQETSCGGRDSDAGGSRQSLSESKHTHLHGNRCFAARSPCNDKYLSEMKKIPALSEKFPFVGQPCTTITTTPRDDDASRTWKGKNYLSDQEELVSHYVTFKGSGELLEEVGSTSFFGVSHPPEPVDIDLMRPVYLPIGKSQLEGKCLVKSLSMQGPFIEDVSIRVRGMKSSTSVLSPAESLIEEPNDMGAVSPPFFSVPRPSQNTENTLLPEDSEEKECIWDASLPPSPLSSMDSTGLVAAMSIVNSCTSTYRSDGFMSDGKFSLDKNCDGGDLHTLRQRQPGKHFSEYAARFYAAEVNPVGIGGGSKRMVGTEVKPGGKYLDFEFF
ncbi:hypothetical protein Vadar_025063 [Vaccinium darrowii]|uniref:Uncharacterized protein n=1 Tax=Vaccinium darrowii TaxID=229202 RepID=A0ACB7ZF37_9ERIC|nr:hypothetical protein Vadar_025063 [Vaccinium darrowii]